MEKMENQHSSAVAFVEGGTQDACEDSCSICLEPFYSSDPSSVTGCNHDFHLQCILEWCQRSSQCPMCWQPVCLKDPTSQMLLEGVQKERINRGNRSRGHIFLRPLLTGLDFEQGSSAESAELDEHLIQQLAAEAITDDAQQLAAEAITDRALEIGEREILSNSNRSINNTCTQAQVLPGNLIAGTGSRAMIGEVGLQVSPPRTNQLNQAPVQTSQSLSIGASGNHPGLSINRNLSGKMTPSSNGIEGPSEFQGFSESLKSRLNAASSRYRDTIRKNTRGWKERLFSRNVTLSDLSSEVKKEVSNGIASVSRMMQRLETKDNSYINEVRKNMNSVDSSPNPNPNASMRLHLARMAASDGSSSSPLPNNASSSNPGVASSSSK